MSDEVRYFVYRPGMKVPAGEIWNGDLTGPTGPIFKDVLFKVELIGDDYHLSLPALIKKYPASEVIKS